MQPAKVKNTLNKKRALPLLIGLLIILTPILYLATKNPAPVEASWWNDSWFYRRKVIVTNNTTQETNVYISFDGTTQYIDTSDTNKFQTDCDDLRFTNQGGKVLQHYVVSGCGTSSTEIQVLIDTFIAGSQNIYYYYGNPSAQNIAQSSAFTTEATNYSIGTPAAEEKGPSPTSYWRLDEGYGTTAFDSSLNANNGTISGPTWGIGAECKSGNCLEFDGSDDFVTVSDDYTLDFTGNDDFTITGWFKHPESISSIQMLVSKFEGTGSDGGYRIWMNSSGNIVAGIDDDNTSFPNDSVTSSQTYNDNQWHNFSFLKDGTTSLSLYIDGQLADTDSTITTGTLTNDDPFNIGMDSDGVTYPFNGYIDDVKVYPYPRTEDEIKTDYNQGGSSSGSAAVFGESSDEPISESLIGYWKMDESSWNNNCSASTVLDYSGNDNHAQACPNSTGPTGGDEGKFGNGGYFDGSNDYLSVAQNSLLNSGDDLTISFWLNSTATSGDFFPTILSKDIGGCPANDWFIDFKGGGNWGYIRFWDGPVCDQLISTYAINDGNWHHVLITRDVDVGLSSLYIDGILNNTLQGSTTSMSNTQDLIIGAIDTSSNRFSGYLDEIRFYNRVFSKNEVETLYKWAPGPVAYYDFEEGSGTSTVYDKSGNGNSGTMTGTFTENDWVTGKYGSALNFHESTNDYISVTDSSSLDITNTITLAAWVKPNFDQTRSNPGSIIDKSTNNDNTYRLMYQSSENDYRFRLPGLSANCDTLGLTWNSGEWHYIAGTYDGSNMRIYYDGVLQNTCSQTGSISTNNDDLLIGDYSDSAWSWDGVMDEIRIYNYARTQEQIISDMNAGHPSPGSPIGSALGHWQFDEGYGDTANDNGTADNDGDLGGSGSSCPGVAACPTWTNDGKFDKALSFDGTSNYIDLNAPSNLGLSGDAAFTISLWANPSATRNDGSFFSYGNGVANRVISINSDGSGNIYSVHYSNDNAFNTSWQLDTWQHVLLTYDPTTSTEDLYVNGEYKESWNPSDLSLTAGDTSYIGRASWNGTYVNTAVIDEIKLYNFAISADQARIEYNQGKSVVFGSTSTTAGGSAPSYNASRDYCVPGSSDTCDPPVAEWLFNEKSGASAYDTSENNNVGTITGSQWEPALFCKTGSCLSFDGSADYVDIGTGPGTVRSMEMWVYPETTTEYLMNLTSTTDYLWIDSSTVTATNVTSPTIYVDGIETDYITADEWHHVVVTTSTAENASNFDLARTADANYLQGKLDNVILYDYVRTPAQIAWSYNKGGPVGWWQFDECEGTIAYDFSGKGNDGTINPNAGTNTSAGTCDSGAGDEMWDNGTTGKIGASLDFDVTDDYIRITDDPVFHPSNSITLMAWVNIDATSCYSKIVCKPYSNSGWSTPYVSWCLSASNACTGKPYLDITTGGSKAVHTAITTLQTSVWYHIAGVWNGSNMKIYINGIQENGQTGKSGTLDYNSQNNDINIGSRGSYSNGEYINGRVDEVKIFNYALTPEQIRENYNAGAIRFD
jgi:hypothetical protein